MKILKLQLILAAAIVALASAFSAHAATLVPDGTYTFSATDGDTALNGSWVTFSSDSIVNWYLNDSLASSPPPTDLPLTPSNSFINSMGVLGTNAWYFIIDGNNIATNYYDFFEGQNNLFGAGTGGGTGALYSGFGDPIGNWGAAAATPDSGTTLGLLALSLAGLVGAKRLVRRALPLPSVK